MKKTFRTGWYGGATAIIDIHQAGTATLTIITGGKHTRKTYNTERGARIAMGKQFDGTWYEIK